jgi:RNA polymerase sigma-70 factor (ECF subfamily)
MGNLDKRQVLTDGERQTFHELYMKHHRDVYRVCLRMTRDVCEAEDLTQDVFVHLFRTIGSFRGESQFSTWLHRLTVNIVLMHFRKRRNAERTSKGGELPAQIAAGSQHPERMRIVDRILLSEVMAKLPDGYREAVILYDIEGLRHPEIAKIKGRSEGTSKSQLHKGRAMLRTLINQSHPQRDVRIGRKQSLPSIA